MSVDIFTALFAGLASFLAPCSFVTIPIMLTNLVTDEIGNKKIAIKRVGLYAAGFSSTFTLLGLGVMGISRFFIINHELFSSICGAILVLMAMFMLFGHKLKKLSFMYSEKKFTFDFKKAGRGGITPFILGAANAFSWTPCIGPVLGAILMLAANNQSFIGGIFLLLAYSLGITIPLIIFVIFFDFFSGKIKLISKYGNIIYKVGAIMILIIGLMLVFGLYDDLTGVVIRLLTINSNAN